MPKGIKGSGPQQVASKPTPTPVKVMIGLPSRGLVHSRTMESVLNNIGQHSVYWSITHDLPIPDCFNAIANAFMDSAATHLWLIEEDMALPEGILDQMLACDKPFVTTDYPTTPALSSIQHEGSYVIGGTGCMLITRAVLDAVKVPYFRSVARAQGTMKILAQPVIYGMQDVDFYVRAQDAGITPYVIKAKMNQWRLKAQGEIENNHGTHLIEPLR